MLKTLQFCFVFAALAGCSTPESKQVVPKPPVASPATTVEHQFPIHPVKKSVPPSEAVHRGPRRGSLLHDAGMDGQSGGGQQIAASADPRIAAAGAVKIWAPVKLENGIIEVCMKTTWSQGKLNVHVALVGPRAILERFVSGWAGFALQFTDNDGNELMKFDIRPQDFEWAPPTVNNGIPTMQLDSSIECPLEPYEQSTNWNFSWN
jgi:hypothetical protein